MHVSLTLNRILGGYEPIASTLFREIQVDVLYLEWETERAGSFAPLRFLPPQRTVVLGLLSSKVGTLEHKDTIIKRIHEAASYCGEGLKQLALSAQCGFSVRKNSICICVQSLKLMLGVPVHLSW